MPSRTVLDVVDLPESALDTRSPVWWGNALLFAIETTTIALLFLSYFYVRKNFQLWPPPLAGGSHPLLNSLPDLPIATANAGLLLMSCLPMFWCDRRVRERLASAERHSEPTVGRGKGGDHEAARVKSGLLIVGAFGIVAIILRFLEFQHLKFSWDDNAYASNMWSLLGMHLFYLVLMAAEVLLAALWIFLRGLSEKLALDTTLVAISWYWTALAGLLIYVVVYWSPRVW